MSSDLCTPQQGQGSSKSPYLVAALYHFTELSELEQLQERLYELCFQNEICGLLLIAEEGINGTIAGPPDGIRRTLAGLRADPRLTALEHKESSALEPPFRRLKIQIKKEIVTMGRPEVDPRARVGQYVSPTEWDALINDPDTLLIDTRNDYEIKLGSFRGAESPNTKSFREFPDWVEANRERLTAAPKIAMFCTGGIRCEKASSYMLQEGFPEVYHLHGGILKYLEEVPESESSWEGDCFVFDERVSLGHQLALKQGELCHGCRRPLTEEDKLSPAYVPGVSCPECIAETSEAQKARFAERHRQRVQTQQGAKGGLSREEAALVGQLVLYSARRSPAAISARLALWVSGLRCELREVHPEHPPASLLRLSRRGILPSLAHAPSGTELEGAVAICRWALEHRDPEGWLPTGEAEEAILITLIGRLHEAGWPGSSRRAVNDSETAPARAVLLSWLTEQLEEKPFLHGERFGFADLLAAPWLRRLSRVAPAELNAHALRHWLKRCLSGDAFSAVMEKYPRWEIGAAPRFNPVSPSLLPLSLDSLMAPRDARRDD